MQEPVKLTVSGILNDLKNGLTRTKDDRNYNPENGSIQEKYNLNKTQVKQLFQHPKLKGKKTITASTPAFVLVDDLEADPETFTVTVDPTNVNLETVVDTFEDDTDVDFEETAEETTNNNSFDPNLY